MGVVGAGGDGVVDVVNGLDEVAVLVVVVVFVDGCVGGS